MLLLVMLISVTISFSQVVKYKTTETKVGYADWKPVEGILVVMNRDEDKIDIYSQVETHLDVLRETDKQVVNDGTAWFFMCVDSHGSRCQVMFKKFNNTDLENIATLVLTYSDVEVKYRLKND